MNVLVINGANLNMLGKREPEIYGRETLDEINLYLKEYAKNKGLKLDFFQSNLEGEIINRIHDAYGSFSYIIINPGAFTHTSIAIRDALLSVGIPFIEVHLSNVYSREPFRKFSYLSDVAKGVITGFGRDSYLMAIDYIARNVR
ncbi:3-dehydroquinate dehydratase [Calditerrivibrio nitroreducens DSM 19672]|uniref:3-dehydroquinate dehydratase n=2 Tax=Calditerrivibrio nitroreducens TaxID=477976 RepID=E4TJI2_CALNY|nr:type II 3-dehydroquinate dehydratase [Calditerrivibrio nitroreducens]ADR18144.1 3-dehydroquinate dehydratase [Calditerrivibrio nitroreducens DSM 19672]